MLINTGNISRKVLSKVLRSFVKNFERLQQAYLYQTYDLETEEVYKDGAGSEYLGEYYSVHVSEMWEDHSVSWSTFYVSVNFDKVLWKDMVGLADSEFEVYTLEEWRNSSYYPSLDD